LVSKHPGEIGVLSTGEACAVALVLNRMDLAPEGYQHPVDAFDRIGRAWQEAVIQVHRNGWQE
jgi:hypothetical protein